VSRRNSMLLAAVAVVAALAAYWMLVLTPQREEATKLSSAIEAKQTDAKAAEAELATNEKAKAGFKANYALVARLGKAVPPDDDVRSLLVQLNAAADKSKIDFRMIQLGAAAAPADTAGSGDKKGTTGTAGTTAPPPGAAPVGSAGFSAMPFTFSFRGNFFNLGDFLRRVDKFVSVRRQSLDVTGRLMVLNSISLMPDAAEGFPKIRAQITATTYVLPAAQGLTAGANPQAPAGAATTPGATTPAPTTNPPTTTAAIGATR
jgi:hypothetical protein